MPSRWGQSTWIWTRTARRGTVGAGARGAPGDMEEEVFREAGIDPEEQDSPFRDAHLKGERRAYRIPLHDVVVESTRRGLRLRFFLPRGAYATTVLGEVMKVEA